MCAQLAHTPVPPAVKIRYFTPDNYALVAGNPLLGQREKRTHTYIKPVPVVYLKKTTYYREIGGGGRCKDGITSFVVNNTGDDPAGHVKTSL